MAKRSRKRNSRGAAHPTGKGQASTERPATESQSAEMLTVAWMLSVLATISAELLGLILRLLVVQFPTSDRLRILAGTLLLVALLSGLITTGLTALTVRLRRVPPPQPIVVVAYVSGLLPLATVLLMTALR